MDKRRFFNLWGATAAGSTLAGLTKVLSAEFFPGKRRVPDIKIP